MVDMILERAKSLKQALSDFVLEAEGELAVSLETFSAQQTLGFGNQELNQIQLVVDRFIVEGRVGDKSPIDFFLEHEPELTQSDRDLVSSWKNSLIGLFAVAQIFQDGFELTNQITAKHYIVKPNDLQTLETMARYKVGEILLTQIAPVTKDFWMFSSTCTTLGKLGKPKLAVAIGNFKQTHKKYLYSDAPELLEQAWQSVEKHHYEFIDFFGSDEVTLPGYQLNKKLAEFQEKITQKHLTASGIERADFLEELGDEEFLPEELKAAVELMDAETNVRKQKSKTVLPQIELPSHLKTAEQATALSHPRWGQIFLDNYYKLKTLLELNDSKSANEAKKILLNYLKSPDVNSFIWQRLAKEYSSQLQSRLTELLVELPDFNLAKDFNYLMQKYHKPLEPELPETASVPWHLHTLFQEAFVETNQSKSKNKVSKKKTAKGFQR